MDLNLILANLKLPAGTPDESALGLYEMIDQVEIQLPLPTKSNDHASVSIAPNISNPVSEPPSSHVPLVSPPSLIPPPLMMGAIPALSHRSHIHSNTQSKSSNVIIAEPQMRNLQKELVSMIPASVRRKAQPLNNPSKRFKDSKEEEEYSKFMAQFE